MKFAVKSFRKSKREREREKDRFTILGVDDDREFERVSVSGMMIITFRGTKATEDVTNTSIRIQYNSWRESFEASVNHSRHAKFE